MEILSGDITKMSIVKLTELDPFTAIRHPWKKPEAFSSGKGPPIATFTRVDVLVVWKLLTNVVSYLSSLEQSNKLDVCMSSSL